MSHKTTIQYDYSEIIWEELGKDVLRSIILCIKDAYRQSYTSCYDEYDSYFADEFWPAKRRAEIHNNLPIALRDYSHLQVIPVPNEFNHTCHVLITTPHMLLDIVKVRSPGEMVPPTRYRVRYAQERQLRLFSSNDVDNPHEQLYAVLLHGNTKKSPERPAFWRIAFPDKNFTKYVYTIDLMNHFPELSGLSEPEPIIQEIIEKPSSIRLKPNRRPEAVA
jgi:hypothetical protein